MLSLKGEPFDSWYNHITTHDIDNFTFADFTRYLLDLIEDPANRILSAAQQYTDAKQGHSQSVHNFAAYLDTLEAQLPAYTESQRTIHLLTKLRQELRQALMAYQELPATREGLVALASRLETNVRRAGPSQPKSKTGDSKRDNGFRGDKQESSSSHAKRKEHDGSSYESSKRKVSKVICFNCNEEGHIAPQCEKPSTLKDKKGKGRNPNFTPVGQVQGKPSKN